MESIDRNFYFKILSISQRQPVIKLIEKKDRNKLYIKNWKPISFLNVDTKILSKAISNKIKAVLSTLISSQQTNYVKDRFIEESGRLISDIIEIRDWFNPIKTNVVEHIETSQLICNANQLTGFYMMGSIGRLWVNIEGFLVTMDSGKVFDSS